MRLKPKIRYIAFAVAPQLTSELLSWRSQRLIMRLERETGRVAASKAFCQRHGTVIRHGPFSGMRYPDSIASTRNLIPKLVASYEDELHPWIEEVAGCGFETIVNVGSADGYYSVGLALRSPKATVIAFDTDSWARKSTSALAKENNATNVEVRSMCSPKWLRNKLPPNSLLIMDCEGFEEQLLDIYEAPTLLCSDLLVELHEHVVPGVGAKIANWYEATHHIRKVDACLKKDIKAYPEIAEFDPQAGASMISEGRNNPQTWLFLTRKSKEALTRSTLQPSL